MGMNSIVSALTLEDHVLYGEHSDSFRHQDAPMQRVVPWRH